MKKFRFYQPTRIHFGSGGLQNVGDIVCRYGSRCLLVSTSRYGRLEPVYAKVKEYLVKGGVKVFHYDEVMPNPTTEIVDKGVEIAVKNNVDVVVGVGGGSAMDTAKIIALSAGSGGVAWDMLFTEYTNPYEDYKAPTNNVLPVICVSTTSGTGSQVTQAAVITDKIKKEKVTVFHPLCFPKECIVAPQIMMSLPNDITASTAFDAFSHAFEAYINPRASIYTEQLSIEAIKLIAKYLPRVLKENSIEARENLAWADTMAGICLSNAGASIPHPLGEIIGGVCPEIAHGQTLAIVYPEFVRYEWRKNVKKFSKVAKIFEPGLEETSNDIAAEKMYEVIVRFLEDIEMRFYLEDFNVEDEKMQEIVSSPILDILPMAPKKDLVTMLKNGFKR